jgi:hypothetical protein
VLEIRFELNLAFPVKAGSLKIAGFGAKCANRSSNGHVCGWNSTAPDKVKIW